MSIWQPRELIREGQPTGRWHYTCSNSAGIFRAECCRTCDCKESGHPSAEEAIQCFRNYEALDVSSHPTPDEQGRCLECREFTQECITVGSAFMKKLRLCSLHQSLELIAKHYKNSF